MVKPPPGEEHRGHEHRAGQQDCGRLGQATEVGVVEEAALPTPADAVAGGGEAAGAAGLRGGRAEP